MPLFLARNQRDSDAIDIYTKNRDGAACVWATIHADFFSDLQPPYTGTDEHLSNRDAPELECVLITKAAYDNLGEHDA